jgi:hydrogenase small subunit
MPDVAVRVPFLAADEVGRRRFLKTCALAAAAVGLPASAAEQMAEKVASGARPSLIWLQFQECTGCTESLLRTTAPDVAELILSLVSLDYHETLMAASGHQAEKTLHEAMEKNAGKYICIIEGAIPTRENGVFCKIGNKTAVKITEEVAAKAGAIIAIGSCASWGGIPSADPNPTGASGAPAVLKGKTVVTLPGCPANPYNLLGTALQFATFGTLPALDELGRPKFAYARVIHEDCPRRAHFDAGRFATKYGDEGHRQGWCLYKIGCKGPQTHANCSLLHYGEVPGAWPIGVGHPCFGCTEQSIGFRVPLHQTIPTLTVTPPAALPGITSQHGAVSLAAVGVAGLALGAAAGAAYTASRKVADAEKKEKGS